MQKEPIKILEILLENGKFMDHNGVEVEKFSTTHVIGNGWRCSILKDGKIVCKTIERRAEEIHSMMYEIMPDGSVMHTFTKRGCCVRKNSFKLKGWRKSGKIGLLNGEVAERYIYFQYK